MRSPCEECYRRYNKQYSEKCDMECEFAFCMKIFKMVLQSNDGCLHCKHRVHGDIARPDWCNSKKCENMNGFELDINKVIKDYQLQ